MMAGFDIEFDDDFLSGLLESDYEEIAKECLTQAAPILEKAMKSKASQAVQHPGESEMVKSIRAHKPKKGKKGTYIVYVSPTGNSNTKYNRGKRSYPVSNALKAIWMEYGIQAPYHHQAACPFLSATVNASKADILRTMQEVYNRKVKG